MSLPTVRFDKVWKKFRRGERHDSLKDLIPALSRQLFSRNVPKELRQDEFWTLENVSFEVLPGQALGIIGRNGAGKSTTLKLLTKILKPTRGYSSVSGRVGALIEVAAGFHPDLTGRENVYLQGAIMGMRRPDIAARFDEIVDFAGISAFIDTPIKRYSSGMNARLGFSIAAHLNPDVLIIDEVLSVGDMSFQQRCFDVGLPQSSGNRQTLRGLLLSRPPHRGNGAHNSGVGCLYSRLAESARDEFGRARTRADGIRER
jgi:lipopolysaccharide transport system ATP-binding protein